MGDGQVSEYPKTLQALQSCEALPVSVVCVGIGDGPFGRLSSELGREVSNFSFVNYSKVQQLHPDTIAETLLIAMFQNLPKQCSTLVKNGVSL